MESVVTGRFGVPWVNAFDAKALSSSQSTISTGVMSDVWVFMCLLMESGKVFACRELFVTVSVICVLQTGTTPPEAMKIVLYIVRDLTHWII